VPPSTSSDDLVDGHDHAHADTDPDSDAEPRPDQPPTKTTLSCPIDISTAFYLESPAGETARPFTKVVV
jgi:hypothetical protein